jgi:hypothetical protein
MMNEPAGMSRKSDVSETRGLDDEENLPEVGSETDLDEFELESEEGEPGDRRRDPLRRPN